ncbi:hypothetical protein EV702DRAFT_1046903 [Suillus placidus]|uniref:Uncharacterized protein n=1 Tax=Suillus placidus TaxID=48579 RepID=A0A9P6ZRQ5_9AGAM|nr:hypothetical protein EV702DRAFT_1046903 [Suillus placidus]
MALRDVETSERDTQSPGYRRGSTPESWCTCRLQSRYPPTVPTLPTSVSACPLPAYTLSFVLEFTSWLAYPSWIAKLDSDYSWAGSHKFFNFLNSFVECHFSDGSMVDRNVVERIRVINEHTPAIPYFTPAQAFDPLLDGTHTKIVPSHQEGRHFTTVSSSPDIPSQFYEAISTIQYSATTVILAYGAPKTAKSSPSTVPLNDTFSAPKELSKAQIKAVVVTFVEATKSSRDIFASDGVAIKLTKQIGLCYGCVGSIQKKID